MTSGIAAAVERAWSADDPRARALRTLLAPASWLYGAAVGLRQVGFERGWLAVTRVPATVVSVGNLTVGGTGKTPAALWLAERLTARGRRVAIVARGYRKTRPGVVVVGAGAGPLVGPDEGGDEAVMLAHRFAGPILTGERRVDAAAEAIRRFGADTIVLDDGFQHRALHRDADLVLLPGDAAPTRLLPAGPWREPAGALRRACAALAVGDDGAVTTAARAALAAGVPCWRGRLLPQALVRAAAGGWQHEPLDGLRGARVVAVAGIGRPARFVSSLAALGAQVTRLLAFPDHHRYAPADRAAIATAASAPGAIVVTTEKDLVKLDRDPALASLRALRVALEVDDGEALVTRLLGSGGQVASRTDSR